MDFIEFVDRLFDTSDFPSRWNCGQWSARHGWLHIASDLAIWGAYTTIPVALVIMARRHDGVTSSILFRLFALFIFSCGAVHLVEAVIFWHPIYRVSGVLKAGTGLISWVTAIAMIRVAPRALALPALESTVASLRSEIALREETERQFAESEVRFRQTFESAPVGIAHVGLDGSWLRVNEALCTLLRRERDDLLAMTFQDITHPDDVAADEAQVEALVGGRIDRYSMEKRYLRSDETVIWATLTVNMVAARGGEAAYFIAIVQDLSERKSYEIELQEARRQAEAAYEARGEFLANMSHEIRSPMSAILGHTDILLRHLEDPDDRQGVVTIKRSGEHLLSVINDILDLSRLEVQRMHVDRAPCNLATILRDVEALMGVRVEGAHVAFRVGATSDLPTNLVTDAKRLKQILLNLLGNALKFTKAGAVEVSAHYDDRASIVRIDVSDTGIGVPADMCETIFQPFSQGDPSRTREFGGTGLGLSISNRLAELLGGRIELESTPGQGSTFSLVLPVEQASLVVAPYETIETDHAYSVTAELVQIDAYVLLVDDRRDIRSVGQHFLEEAGARVVTAADGAEALDAVASAEERGDPFAIVIMDIQMPVMDGHTASRELRRRGFTGPILALTANAMREDEQRALAAGCDAYLAKPIESDRLVELVARLTGSLSE